MNAPGVHLIAEYIRIHPQEVAIETEKQPVDQVLTLLCELPIQSAVALFEKLIPVRASRALEEMDIGFAKKLFSTADPAKLSPGLSRLSPEKIEALLAAAPESVAVELRESMSYEANTAGGLMDSRVMSFRDSDSAENALASIRASKIKRVHDVYSVDQHGVLVGWVPIQELALADSSALLRDISRQPRGKIKAIEPIDEVVSLLEAKKLSSIPVIDHEDKLIGVIRYDALIGATQENALEDLQAMVGVSRDEKALSPAGFAVRKRLPWLLINLLTAFLAAAVVGLFEGTIAKVTALAVLLPVVAGQSGNTGAQALAVALRGLTVREIRIRHWPKLVRKEFLAGSLNGIAVAIVTGIGVYVWSQSVGLVLVIVISMVISMAIAGVAGAAVPIVLKALNQDPAQSSSIVLTTVTDVFGFFSFLGIATLLMHMLPQG